MHSINSSTESYLKTSKLEDNDSYESRLASLQTIINCIYIEIMNIEKICDHWSNLKQIELPVTSFEETSNYKPIKKTKVEESRAAYMSRIHREVSESGRVKKIENAALKVYNEDIVFKSDLTIDDLYLRSFFKIRKDCRKIVGHHLPPKELEQAQAAFITELRQKINEKKYEECATLIDKNIEFLPDNYKKFAHMDILAFNMRAKGWGSVTNSEVKLEDMFDKIKNVMMAEAHYEQGNNQNAYDLFKKESDISVSIPRNRYQFAEVCFRLGYWQEAAQHFKALISENKYKNLDLRNWNQSYDNDTLQTTIRKNLEVCNHKLNGEIDEVSSSSFMMEMTDQAGISGFSNWQLETENLDDWNLSFGTDLDIISNTL